jgi:hypothetical protein
VQFTFQGKNLGGVKQYDLVRASLDNWEGAWKSDLASTFEGVAKDCFNSTVGKIECQRFAEKTFANSVMRKAEMMSGAKEGTFEMNKVERVDGGIRNFMYTDKNPYNPARYSDDDPPGKGELWFTFKYDDAQLRKGFVTVSEIRQGYNYRWQGGIPLWQDTGTADVQASMRDARWWTGANDAAAAAVLERAGRPFGENALQWFNGKKGLGQLADGQNAAADGGRAGGFSGLTGS